MEGTRTTSARRSVVGLVVAAAAAAVIAQVVEGPPGNGYGWVSVAISCLLLAGPLTAVALIVASGAPRLAWVSLVLVLALLGLVLLALVGNWAGQSTAARGLDIVVAVLVVAAAVGVVTVQVPLIRR